ncbi:hypothetical protein HBI56_127580 [Parastagonospora nodorum]|nr:hypothetical protein HBH56_168940 [Parastagonospora nodorum]KAH3936264.1 hypothetical protein HBH54_032030 [Parastagonospora nodorum]KAH3948368.1 hypothetical protein HBH53_106800 [Parastagonospora nodorum]KAH3968823.1 hypothetical protein HBH51_130710 [Parastagonospora nodorum]KAH3989816.1 hypothetical protein HBH52_011270 [Parastagonospora nodorum]
MPFTSVVIIQLCAALGVEAASEQFVSLTARLSRNCDITKDFREVAKKCQKDFGSCNGQPSRITTVTSSVFALAPSGIRSDTTVIIT